jgi:hypothetical protein
MSKTITVPIGKIEIPSQIMDLLNGNSRLALLNPWFKFEGLESPLLSDFMQIKSAKTKDNKDYKMIQNNPFIIYKTDDGNYAKWINFTQDNGEKSLTTNFNFFDLRKYNLDAYTKEKFKQIQKCPSTRGKFSDIVKHECIINYVLTQAYEFCLIAMILGIKEFKFTKNGVLTEVTNDALFIEMIKSIVSVSDCNTALTDYLTFNKGDDRYILNIKAEELENPNDILWILRNVLKKKKSKYSEIIMTKSIMVPATYVMEYKPPEKDETSLSTRTDYNVTYTDPSEGTLHLTGRMKAEKVLQPEDYIKIVGKRQIGKIYIRMDFDYRINGKDTLSDKAKNVMRLRYTIKHLFHNESKRIVDEVEIPDMGNSDEDEIDKPEMYDGTDIQSDLN